ncbi:MAG: GntR family transcriptional regulator [Verrucomicrobiales bacterium]|nr:GntR family transcriptional regulator [Verrucomicrobiales bacterium]
MRIQVQFDLGQPVYAQIMDQIKAAAASGALQSGEPLPGIRPLAEELRVNRNTVAKAYLELEREGVIETRPGKGCFLRNGQTRFHKAARAEMLVPLIDSVVVQAHHLQVRDEEVLSLLRARIEHFRSARRDNEPVPGN